MERYLNFIILTKEHALVKLKLLLMMVQIVNIFVRYNSLCNFYVIDNDKCYLFAGNSSTSVKVNCATKKQNNLSFYDKYKSLNGLGYQGIGFVKSKYYQTDGSNAFTYNDVILEKANEIKK